MVALARILGCAATLKQTMAPHMALRRELPHRLLTCVRALAHAQPWARGLCQGSSAHYNTIAVHNKEQHAVIELNRPKALNALSTQVMQEVTDAALSLDADASIKAIVVTGSGRAFCAGADLKEMAPLSRAEVLHGVRKPLVAAVNGVALGGGLELALLCDIILASEAAVFGLPELSVGVIPGIGGTQRLTRLVGRALAMDMVLTGRRLSAREALSAGLVSRVVAPGQLLAEAEAVAGAIASASRPAVAAGKACIHGVDELGLAAGLELERREFWDCFDRADQKEGMHAFIEKRKPQFSD